MEVPVPAADRNPTLLDLLAEWEEQAAAGQPVLPDVICRGHPELLNEFLDVVGRVQRIHPLLTLDRANVPSRFPPIPGFELLEEIGQGGMGSVFTARDEMLGRIVAVKVPHGVARTDANRRRFEREARTLARLRHPNIVTVHAAGVTDDGPYIVMDYISGGSVSTRKHEFAGDNDRVTGLVEQVARAVGHAHRNGIVHRDLKPSNIFLDTTGRPLVGDFGIAAIWAGEPLVPGGDDTPPDRTEQTRTNNTVGTPAYAAPELLPPKSVRAGPAADVWSLGVILFELLTGRLPETGGESQKEKWESNTNRSAIHDSELLTLPRGLSVVVSRCLAAVPTDRYATAEAVADALSRWRRGQIFRRRLRATFRWVLVPLLVVIGIAMVTWPKSEEAKHADVMREIGSELRAGRPVTIVGVAGPPKSWRIRLGESAVKTGVGTDGTFAVAAGTPTLVELLADPGADRYEVTAEIRQDGFFGPASLGLYFGHHAPSVDRGDVHSVGMLQFSDFGPGVTGGEAGKMPTSLATITYCFLVPPLASGKDSSCCSGPWVRYEPHDGSNRPPGKWRHLTVRVSPTVINGLFDGHDISDFRIDDIHSNAVALFKTHPRLLGKSATVFMSGGIGIFARNCELSVRNVRVRHVSTP